MRSLSSLLGGINLPRPLKQGVLAALAVEYLNDCLVEIFGPTIKQSASARYVKNNIALVACLSGSAAQEIKLHEPVILAQVNKRLRQAFVKKIQCQF